jgi:hypothetical protein
VAARLAVIYLMNRKAERTLATLRTTRSPDLSNELRNQRLLLEARALSELGRHDLAFEVASNIQTREAVRLRADILWAAKRWREASEQIELLYGERWREFEPLGDAERPDIRARRSASPWPRTRSGSTASARNTPARWARGPISAPSRWSPLRSRRAAPSFATSPAPSRR